MKFPTFADAKKFAIQFAKDHGRSVLVTKSSNGWIVHVEAEAENIRLDNPDNLVTSSAFDDFDADPILERAIDSWQHQKSLRPTCYKCNGTGSGNGRMCHACMGRGYIHG